MTSTPGPKVGSSPPATPKLTSPEAPWSSICSAACAASSGWPPAAKISAGALLRRARKQLASLIRPVMTPTRVAWVVAVMMQGV